MSYAFGTIIAAAVVGSLIMLFYFSSDAYAAQALLKKPVSELVEIVTKYQSPRRPSGAEKGRVLGAVLLLGEGDDQIQQRVDAIAVAGEHSGTEYESSAKIAIKKLGPATLPILQEMLDSGNQSKIVKAIICIRLLGEDAKTFVPQLIEMIESGEPDVIRMGVFALQDMGPSAAPAVDALNGVILSLDFNAQIMVCKAASGMGRDAAPLADNLAKIFAEGVPSARSWAGIALGAIGPIANFETAEMLASRIDAFSHVEKTRALDALAMMGDEAVSQADVIKKAMQDPKGRIRPQAAYAYYRVTGETEEATKTMIEMLPKRSYQSDTLDYLRLMGPGAKDAIGAVRNLLTHESVGVREQAVLVLGSIGAHAFGEINAIEKLASDPDPLLRQAVEESIAAIKKDYEASQEEKK